MIQDKILDIEQSVIGKSSSPWVKDHNDISFTYLGMGISIIYSLLSFINITSDEGTSIKVIIFAALVFLATFLAVYLTVTSILKLSFRKNPATTLLGIISAWIIYLVVSGFGHFALIDADWEVVWANRVLVIVGQLMTESLTQSYLPNQSWRLWSVLYLTFALISAAYGTTGDKPYKFLIPFTIFCGVLIYIAWNPTAINYNSDEPVMKLIGATILSYITFGLSYYYCSINEEYKANKLRSYLALSSVFVFFFAVFIMNPPEAVQELCADVFGISSSENIQLTRCGGVEASQWGGIFVNLIVATAGCVLGFGVGVVLAFGRQSELPFFKYPSVALIETVRSGPLICWLYFAVFLLPDIIDPFMDIEDIMRMLLIFGLFGGCYIAEVLRGGLQSVDSGQKEAALALGLSPMQTKLQVELPNAVRTTLPSIVSVFIGLWKDTTLLFIINILDFFKLAKDLPNTSPGYLGDFLEPLYVTALVFWIFAFYLSRISMRIEKGLGLTNEGGGEAA
jgi:His/Glu/Gln/Arg/opine family amino acid ABC transporter permease subunit